MRLPTPATVDVIETEWLNSVLHVPPIAHFQCRPIGDAKGVLSSTAAIELVYAEPSSAGPRSMVVKIEPKDAAMRSVEREIRAFEREIRFYREVAPGVSMRLPTVYYTAEEEDASILIMEDLTAMQCGDQVRGLNHHQVLATVRQIARLHATYWNHPKLQDLDWTPEHDPFWDQGLEGHWDDFSRDFGTRVGSQALRLAESVLRHETWLRQRIAERPHTLIHGDLRADNVLFACDKQEQDAIVIDWQLLSRSLGSIDPTRLLGGSEPAAERKGHQLETFSAWHEELLLAGLGDYPLSEALEDFRLGVLYNLRVPLLSYALLEPDRIPRHGRLLDAQVLRHFASAIELNAGSLLPGN